MCIDVNLTFLIFQHVRAVQWHFQCSAGSIKKTYEKLEIEIKRPESFPSLIAETEKRLLNLLRENRELIASNSVSERKNELLQNLQNKNYETANSMSEKKDDLERKIS